MTLAWPGLCGNFNQNQADDFTALSGVVEGTGAAFANTWKTQASCPNAKNLFEDPCSLSVENGTPLLWARAGREQACVAALPHTLIPEEGLRGPRAGGQRCISLHRELCPVLVLAADRPCWSLLRLPLRREPCTLPLGEGLALPALAFAWPPESIPCPSCEDTTHLSVAPFMPPLTSAPSVKSSSQQSLPTSLGPTP